MLAHRAGGDRTIAGAIVPNATDATDAPPRSSPQPLPPLRRRDLTRVHARFHLIGIPACEPDERLRFALLTGCNLVEVALRLGAGRGVALPWMAQHVARLEVLPIARLLEHEVLGQRIARIAQVQPREQHRLRTAGT